MIKLSIRKSEQCNGEYSVFASFDYNETVLDIVKSFPTRYWNKLSKEWEVPYKKIEELVYALRDYDIEIVGNLYVDEIEEFRRNKKREVSNFTFKTEPFDHQVDGFHFGLEHDRWLLGDEQGLGKTKQVIDIAVAKKQQLGYKHCLIICGVNGLKWNWQNEIKTHSNETGYILGQRMRKNKVYIGSNKDKLADLENKNVLGNYFLITNVESLRDENIALRLSQMCKDGTLEMVAIDEVHKCKNPSSQQGKGILKIQPECRIAMTGTPLMNTPMDLFIILKWLGYEKHAFYQFKNHYCVMGGYGGYEVIGYKNMDELQDTLKSIMLRRLKEDVLDLPEKIFVDEFVDMTPKQAQIYKEISMDIRANLDKIAASNNPLAELIRMRQATGYTGIVSSTVLESAKIDRLEELIEETSQNGKKMVIFSQWTQMTDAVYERLSKNYKGVVITGQTDDADRQNNVVEFQNNPKCSFILGTVGAMGTGLTLTAGTVVVFLDHPWNRALYDQAVDRTHRIGQKSNVTIYNLLCKNTIDEKIWDLVQKKGAMSDALIDDKIVGNKTEILNYLLS